MNRTQLWRVVYLCVFFLLSSSGLLASTPPVDLSPNGLNLGSQAVATTSGAGSVSLTNHLSTPLSISGISTVGDFAQTNNCPLSLAPGRSCTIKVTFTPTAVGARSGQLIVTDSDSTSPQLASLSGTGTATGLSSIVILPSNPSVPAGRQQQFTALGYFKNGNGADLTTSVVWTSSNSTLATISNSSGTQGLATALKQGVTNITATLGSVAGATTFTVAPPALTSLSVSPQISSVRAGKMLQFTATGTFSDGTTQTLTTAVTWSSSDPSIASISNAPGTQGLVTGLKQGITNISAILNGIGGSTALAVTTLTSITVSPQNSSLFVGKKLQFTATGTFSDGTTDLLTTSVTWTSSDNSLATISNSPGTQGLVTGIAAGHVQITATFGSLASSSNLTVAVPTLVSINVSPQLATIFTGQTLQFSATGTFSDGSQQDITASSIWQSSDSNIATIGTLQHGIGGLATAVAAGIVTIAVGPANAHSPVGTAQLTVHTPQIDSLAISEVDPSILIADKLQLTAIGHFTDGTSKDMSKQVIWSSANSTVATISNGQATPGLITGITEGNTTISAAVPSSPISASTNLTVSYQPPSSVSLSPANISLPLGDVLQFAAIVTFADGNSLDWSPYVNWTSSDPPVAVSSAQGRVTSLALGSTTITASLGAVLGSSTLTVTPLVPGQARFVFVSNISDSAISTYRVNSSTGLLTPIGTTSLGAGIYPRSMATDSQHKFLYTANPNSFSISGFAIDPTSGSLSALAGSPFASQFPGALAVDPLGKFLYAADGTGSAITYSMDASGIPTHVTQTPQANGAAVGIAIVPSGKFVYTANINANTVSFFSVDAPSGALTLAGQVATGLNPESVTLDSSGKFLLAPNGNGQSVSVYSLDPNSGVPNPVLGSPFAAGVIPIAVAFHPSGNFAYAVNQGSNTVSAFAVDSSGVFSPISGSPFAIPGGSGPAAVSVDPLGKWLYVLNQSTNNIAIFSIDSMTGALTSLGSIATGQNPISIVLTQ